jgi:myo-inositol-1(or 4)-monophosphatase
MNYSDILKDVRKIVVKTGKYQLEKFSDKKFHIDTKSSVVDLVTEVDLESEKMILSHLTGRYPDISYISEERGASETTSEYKWILDPLDGTTNFAQGLPIFSISLALVKKDVSVLGVVYVPSTDEFFYAVKGEGAFLNDFRINVSDRTDLEQCVLATGFSYSRSVDMSNNLQIFAYFAPKVRGLRRMGSASYDMCNVARGALDGYWEMNLRIWDVAAGDIIIKEAGGGIRYFEQKDGISLGSGNDEICGVLYKKISEYL